MTVADLRQRMSGEEWTEWSVYYGMQAQRNQVARKRGGHRG